MMPLSRSPTLQIDMTTGQMDASCIKICFQCSAQSEAKSQAADVLFQLEIERTANKLVKDNIPS